MWPVLGGTQRLVIVYPDYRKLTTKFNPGSTVEFCGRDCQGGMVNALMMVEASDAYVGWSTAMNTVNQGFAARNLGEKHPMS